MSVQINPTTTPEANPLTADTSGSDFTLASYDIAPEDQEEASRILNFDPVFDTKGPTTWTGGNIKAPSLLKATMLAPATADPIKREVAQLAPELREQREHELVSKALYANSKSLRIKAGPGAEANAYQREVFQIAGEIHRLEKEQFELQRKLVEVERWVPVLDAKGNAVFDPATGQQQLRAVESVQGDNRRQMEARERELAHRIALLQGVEGDRREAKALKATIEHNKALRAQIEDDQTARQRADEIVREERIEKLAQAYAKNRRSAL